MTTYEKTLGRAFRLLSFKPRSVAEMRARLLEKDWTDEPAVDRVIARLQELDYLNDEQFAASLANSRLAVKPVGRVRLRRDLQRKKLSSQTVETALDEAYEERGEEQLIEQALAKRLRLKGAPKTPEEAKKLFDYLMRRGFSYELVRCKVRDAGKIEIGDED
ncbi:MAG: regulatory protein RecX [Blastocatellia bacterium]